MQTQFNEELTAATSKSYETLKNLGDINSSALRKITDLQFDFISMNVESGIEQAKSLNSKKDAKDIFASSAEFVSDYNEKMLGFTNQTVEILTESSNEAKSLFENDGESEGLTDYAQLLYGQAALAEGAALDNPAVFAKLVAKLTAFADYAYRGANWRYDTDMSVHALRPEAGEDRLYAGWSQRARHLLHQDSIHAHRSCAHHTA